MDFESVAKFRLKRVNPFQGLVIDTDTWRDAHEYHRDQQRLHLLAFHDTGIIAGLEVVANNPADLSVNIRPGIAVDSQGNIIIVPEAQHYRLQSKEKGNIHLIIQFREVPAEPFQPPDGGQPTRIVEAYRIQEREQLPDEPHLELARVNFDPAAEAIKDAPNPSQPGTNQIDLRHRREATRAPAPPPPPAPKAAAPPPPPAHGVAAPAIPTVPVGHVVLGEAAKGLHAAGLRNLVRDINRQSGFAATMTENVPLDKNISRFKVLYLTGNSRFELNQEQQSALAGFLKSGGTIFGEGCSDGHEGSSRGSKEFGLAFNQLANSLSCKLEVIQRDHALLSARHVFSEVPQGVEPAMLLEGGHMIYSGSDYGCAWSGGREDSPLARDVIRSAFEIGNNVIAYSQMLTD